jgi:predicted signal transduction protein with EAL and GGDEF domain
LSLLVGRLNVDGRVDGATLFAQHTEALLDVSLALRREQDAAVTDALTGLLNRRGFDVRLNEELERASHTGSGVALLLADCGDLKAINDRGGHELGDRVLEAFASCVRGCKRTQDAGARIGGDESQSPCRAPGPMRERLSPTGYGRSSASCPSERRRRSRPLSASRRSPRTG